MTVCGTEVSSVSQSSYISRALSRGLDASTALDRIDTFDVARSVSLRQIFLRPVSTFANDTFYFRSSAVPQDIVRAF